MQEDVRNVVLSYLRAQDIRFVWRDGFVEIPDARGIPRLASGRPTLSLTFDRDAAGLLKNVDYVTFGHPMLDQILEELRGQAAYVERFFGTDLESLLRDGVPHVTWQELTEGSVTPRVSRGDVRYEHLLLVRLQLDIESDYRHLETFGVLVDLTTARVVPERASIGQRSSRTLPDGFTPPAPGIGFEQAIAIACDHARAAGADLLESKRLEAEQRLANELQTAAQGGQSPEQLEHLERELGRKYNVSAKFTVVGVERWFVQSDIQFSVRVPDWGKDAGFTLTYDLERQTTHVGLTSAHGTSKNPTHIRLCAEQHGDTETRELTLCSECGKRYCDKHVSQCDVTAAMCCKRDLAACEGSDHDGMVVKRVLRQVDGRTLCPWHIKPCADCGQEKWTAQLETCAITAKRICRSCMVACHDCSVALSARSAIRCERSDEPVCEIHAARCAAPDCGKTVRYSATVTLEEDGHSFTFCAEHIEDCAAGHAALSRSLEPCDISRDRFCPRHVGTCTCGRLVSSALLKRSAASGRSVCPACRVACADCKRFFSESETAACGLSGALTCAEDLIRCAEPGCGKSARLSLLIPLGHERFCPDHIGQCTMGHPALRRRVSECAISGERLCDLHTGTCTCSRLVSKQLLVPSAASGRDTCPACAVPCGECQRVFLEEETEVCVLTKRRTCRSDLIDCAHADCGRRIGKSSSVMFRDRQVCSAHRRPCPDDETHETLDDLLAPCTVQLPQGTCGHRACDVAEHRCQACGRVMCTVHRRHSVGAASERICPPCLGERAQCPGCAVPLAAVPCPLCADVARQPFRAGLQLPERVEQACEDAGVPVVGSWRVGVHGDAQLWERRIGLRTERFAFIENDPLVYRRKGGALKAIWSMFRGS